MMRGLYEKAVLYGVGLAIGLSLIPDVVRAMRRKRHARKAPASAFPAGA